MRARRPIRSLPRDDAGRNDRMGSEAHRLAVRSDEGLPAQTKPPAIGPVRRAMPRCAEGGVNDEVRGPRRVSPPAAKGCPSARGCPKRERKCRWHVRRACALAVDERRPPSSSPPPRTTTPSLVQQLSDLHFTSEDPALTRILIADDHEVVRSGLQAILEAHDGWNIVAEAENGKDAITKALSSKPDVAIIDYSLPVINGIEATRQIRARLPDTEVLIFTMHDSDVLVRELLEAGARGYLLKSDANKYVIAAVDSLVNHMPFFTARVSDHLLESYLAGRSLGGVGPLSPRERTIVHLLAEGHSNKAIARILNLSIKTIESRRATVMRKLNVTSTAVLVRYAIRNKLIEP
jgi:DNA-binding NarL/FixJ family response regulator